MSFAPLEQLQQEIARLDALQLRRRRRTAQTPCATQMTVDGRPVQIRRLEAVRTEPEGTVYRVVIHEGRNRIIRRVFERVGYPVLRLHRVRVGPLWLGNLAPGQWRDLTPEELAALRRAVGLSETAAGAETKEREQYRGRTVQLRGRDRRSGRIGQKYRRR